MCVGGGGGGLSGIDGSSAKVVVSSGAERRSLGLQLSE